MEAVSSNPIMQGLSRMNNQIKTWINRTTSITATALCVFCCLPQEGMALEAKNHTIEQIVKDFVDQGKNPNNETFQEQIAKIIECLEESEDPLSDGYRFLQILLNQVNANYGYSFSMPQMFDQIRGNLHLIQIPEIEETDLRQGLEMLEEYAKTAGNDHSKEKWSEHCFNKNPPKKKKHKMHTWGKVVIVFVAVTAAVTISILQPEFIPAVVEGAVAIATSALKRNNIK